jgi:hypothetical protein
MFVRGSFGTCGSGITSSEPPSETLPLEAMGSTRTYLSKPGYSDSSEMQFACVTTQGPLKDCADCSDRSGELAEPRVSRWCLAPE